MTTCSAAPPLGPAARELVGTARRGLRDAALATRPADRFAGAHLAALRAAAAVLAARARPAGSRRRPRSVWSLLPTVAPELTEWASFFAAGAAKRAAAEAGLDHVVSAREADDLVREAGTFLALVTRSLGIDRTGDDRYGLDPAGPTPTLDLRTG